MEIVIQKENAAAIANFDTPEKTVMHTMQIHTLAQTMVTSEQWTQLAIYAGALLLLALLFLVYRWIRKRMISNDQKKDTPFTLDEIRKMHRSGHISEEEYKSLRDRILNDL